MTNEQQALALSLLFEFRNDAVSPQQDYLGTVAEELGIDGDLCTIDQWRELGMAGAQYVQWVLAGPERRRTVRASPSVNRAGGWLVAFRQDDDADTVLATGVKPQRARDVANFLRGEASFSLFSKSRVG